MNTTEQRRPSIAELQPFSTNRSPHGPERKPDRSGDPIVSAIVSAIVIALRSIDPQLVEERLERAA